MFFDTFSYIPILGLKPADMAALEELPEKDKDLLLPLLPLKRWTTAASLDKACNRIEKAFGVRKILIDIDKEFLLECKSKDTPIAKEFCSLGDSTNGYENWIDLFKRKTNYLPVLQLEDLTEFITQVKGFIELNLPIVLRIEMKGKGKVETENFKFIIRNILLLSKEINNLLILLDYTDYDRTDLLNYSESATLIRGLGKYFPDAKFSISGTSFPYSFAGSYKGEIPIYERLIYNKIQNYLEDMKIIYSDRASTRANSIDGGGGTPLPRIDYPLKNDWRFVRKEFTTDDENEKDQLYQEAAIEVVKSDYWDENLHLWGTQMIERTALRDPYGINSPQKATSARINIHLYNQLHYMDNFSDLDTDEEWVD